MGDGSTTAREEEQLATEEEIYLAYLADLRQRWAGNRLVLGDLARSWQMGMQHAQKMDSYADARSFINPFW